MKYLWCVLWGGSLWATSVQELDRFTQTLEVNASVHNEGDEDRMIKITQGTALSSMQMGYYGVQPLVVKGVRVRDPEVKVYRTQSLKKRLVWVVQVPPGETVALTLVCYCFAKDFEAPSAGERLSPTGLQISAEHLPSMQSQGSLWNDQYDAGTGGRMIKHKEMEVKEGYGYGATRQAAMEDAKRSIVKSAWNDEFSGLIGSVNRLDGSANGFQVSTSAFMSVGWVPIVAENFCRFSRTGDGHEAYMSVVIQLHVRDGVRRMLL